MFLTIHFNPSKSKYYSGIIRLGKKFQSVKTESGKTIATFSFDEIVEKWDEFSVFYWTVIKWKNSVVEFKEHRFNSYQDKTSIFYDIQSMHADVMLQVRQKIAQQAKQVIKGSKTKVLKNDRLKNMSNAEIDAYIDVMLNSEE